MNYIMTLLLVLTALPKPSVSQEPSPLGSGAKSPVTSVATTVVSFKNMGPISGLRASPVLESPMQCADGATYVRMFDPPDFVNSRLYSISGSGEVHGFSPDAVNELFDVNVRNYYPTGRDLIMLVSATRSSEKKQMSFALPDGSRKEVLRYTGEHHNFMLSFDHEGSYKGAVELPAHLTIDRVAAFANGNFLGIGTDNQTHELRLVLLGSDGAIIKYVDVPRALAKQGEAEKKKIPGSGNFGSGNFGMVPYSQLLPFQDFIMVVAADSTMPVLEVSPGGAVRSVRLQLPPKAVIHGFIPSSTHWYVRTSPAGKGALNTATDTADVALYEFNPSSGQLVRRLLPEGVTADDIGCADGEDFIAFTPDENGGFLKFVGTVIH